MKSPPTNRLLCLPAVAGFLVCAAVCCAQTPADLPPNPALQLSNLTLDLYRVALDHPSSCADLTAALDQFLNTREPDFIAALAALDKALIEGEEVAQVAATFQDTLSGHPLVLEGQAVIYACIKAKETQGKKRSLTKVMQRLYAYHDTLLRQLLGPID